MSFKAKPIMKKILFLLPILLLSSLSATGCKTKLKARITFGTYIDEGLTEIKYSQLAKKVSDGDENFLISVYDDSDKGMSCGCWTQSFRPVLEQYVKEYHTRIYIIGRSQFSEDDDKFGLTILDSSSTDPTFALFKKGKKANQYIYNAKEPMFYKLESFREAVMNIASDPQFFYVDRTYLQKAIFDEPEDKVIVQYVWSFCPDCNDCFPYVIIPYGDEHSLSTKMYFIDLAVPGLLLNDLLHPDKTNENYVAFMQEYHLSAAGDEVFGYDRGFVPTTQVWEKGVLKDATCYFNDEVSINDAGEYYVSRSFYSEARVANLGYTDKVVEGKVLTEADVTVGEDESISWNKDSAREIHKPLLEAFLDKYAK